MVDFAASVLSVVAQQGVDVDIALGPGLAGGGVGAFVTTLVVGAILVAVFPGYTERMMAAFLDDPVSSFAYGFFSVIALVLLAVLLTVTIVGILFVIPLLIVAYVLWAVGSAVAFLAIADRLVDRGDGWLKPLVVAAAMNGLLALTGAGALVGLCIGAAGFGVVLQSGLRNRA